MGKWNPIALLIICLWGIQTAGAQTNLNGWIFNADTKEPLPGANIGIVGTFYQAQSDVQGNFTIKNIKPGKANLKISFIGFKDTTLLIDPDFWSAKTLEIALKPSRFLAQEVVVQATRASKYTAGTYNQLSKAELAKINLGQDMPFLLNQLPSVVVNSDAGAGVGYTGISIRGSDATRINVTINGIPVNDAESHGMFWVNLPDFASSVENVQVQRGVGTSTNGAAAFGGSINFQTQNLSDKPYAEILNTYGSFNTHKHSFKAGSGLIGGHFIFDTRFSLIGSDGYIDRASTNLKSFYISGGYFGKTTSLKLITFSGIEKTYQAWNGVPEDSLKTNRTFNEFTYENQTDNYQQDYYQLILNQNITSKIDFNFALHYTRGKGYYEEFKQGADFTEYGLSYPILGNDTLFATDLVRQKWLDNHFYGFTFSLDFKPSRKLNILLGGAGNQYDGGHYGKIIWTQNAPNITKDYEYYNDKAVKTDLNFYLKTNWKPLEKLSLFVDLQLRHIAYEFQGFDELLAPALQNTNYLFFNPKAGLTLDLNAISYLYASYSIGHREPVRNDFTDNPPSSRPKPESMQDIELGYKRSGKQWSISANAYAMLYKNQLVVTGKINDVGAYIRQNVDNSYRIGLELQAGLKILKSLVIQGNLSLSQNKILDFKEFIDDYDNGGQVVNTYAKTDIALSPAIISAGSLVYTPLQLDRHSLSLSLTEKYVGRQFLDNTSQTSRSLNAFFVNDFRFNYTLKSKVLKELNLIFSINNLFDVKYEPNGYTYSYIYGGLNTFNFYYPQAGRNYMLGLGLKF
jgi:iron complex outermembrane receptor protein